MYPNIRLLERDEWILLDKDSKGDRKKHNRIPRSVTKGLVTCRDTLWEILIRYKGHTNMTKKLISVSLAVLFSAILTGCHDVNCLPDSHFTEDGVLKSKPDSSLVMLLPSKVKFFMEASGSMNGLYRPGCKTEFRDDVYQIVSYYLSDADFVYILCTNNGTSGYQLSLREFGHAIKSQGFSSMNTTSITDMIETVVANIDTLNNQVGVLISDMKYDPNGVDDIDYQLGMYTTKVSHITSEANMAFSLVAAASKYYDRQGGVVAEKSPYYYLIIGTPQNVAKVRDDISTILMINKTFVDNIETGMTYGGPSYSIEKVRNCLKENNYAFSGVSTDEPCKIKLNLSLENYRWLMGNEEAIKATFSCKMLHGSKIDVDSISVDSIYKDKDNRLDRKITASIYLSISNMQSHCDVVEWNFNPCSIDSEPGLIEAFIGAHNWRDFDKSYSIDCFIKGMFRAAHLNTCSTKPNYILISTH